MAFDSKSNHCMHVLELLWVASDCVSIACAICLCKLPTATGCFNCHDSVQSRGAVSKWACLLLLCCNNLGKLGCVYCRTL